MFCYQSPTRDIVGFQAEKESILKLLSVFEANKSPLVKKAVMVSHANVIANVLQVVVFESVPRNQINIETQNYLAVLPFSHIYALVLVCTVGQYRGDQGIVLPKYNFDDLLGATQRFSIQQIFVVPPMLIHIIGNPDKVAKYDLSSVRFVYCGAAPLGPEIVDSLLKMFPKWRVGQGYGMTECSPTVCTTNELDVLSGSSGSLLPGKRAKLIDLEGKEVTKYDTPGELLIQSPAVVLGYLNNEKANAETFIHHEDGRWLRTGDEVIVRKSAQGHEHIIVVDRIKELIKTKVRQGTPNKAYYMLKSSPPGLTNMIPGSSSCSSRIGSPPPYPPLRLRLCHHPRSGHLCRRGAQGLRRQIRHRMHWQVRQGHRCCHPTACKGAQGQTQVARWRHRVHRCHSQEPQR